MSKTDILEKFAGTLFETAYQQDKKINEIKKHIQEQRVKWEIKLNAIEYANASMNFMRRGIHNDVLEMLDDMKNFIGDGEK